MKRKYKMAKMSDSFMFGLDGKILCNTLYYVINVGHNFNIEAYKKSLKYVVRDLPILSCKFSLGFWRDRWEYISDFDVEQIFQEIYLEEDFSHDKNSFYETAFSKFIELKNNCIDITKEAPFKIKVFCTKQLESKVVVWELHHTVTDGRGMLQIIELAGKYYNSILNGKNADKGESSKKSFKDEFFTTTANVLKVIFYTAKNLLKRNTIPKLEPVLELEEIQAGDDKYGSMSLEKFKIDLDEINKLKSLYGVYKFTINDIILHNILKFNMNYGLNLKKMQHLY
ncbi:condensation domain-containing protein [Clostridium acetobutylicum]|uniref:condensation domain-containing protein n=1 Tax=Clostridium acetobutylicum TaxID=1488 RepID=UPI0017A9164E|nr:condensation domain-containing protein [Clostridium acetobutylicum]NYC94078.1 NRPS condensation-like uncharacterized protein [Clostridium acetobutylicum]